MVRCKINEHSLTYPSSWDELSLSQLIYIIRLYFSGIPETELRIKALIQIVRLKFTRRRPVYEGGTYNHLLRLNKKTSVWLSDVQLTAMSDKLQFLTQRFKNEFDLDSYTLDSHLTINLFDRFRHRLVMYYGPSDKLFNISFGEFITAETNFNRYVKDKQGEDLDKLIATLYRPKAKNIDPLLYEGDMREAFNDHLVDGRAAKLKKLDHVIKVGILLYYQGCRKFIMKRFPAVFKKSKKNTTSAVPGFLALVDALAMDDVTKTQKVYKEKLYTVMVRLQKAAEKYDEMQAELEKKKQKTR